MMRYYLLSMCVAALVFAGCKGREPGSANLTKGALSVQCDESIYPAGLNVAEEFQRLYPDTHVNLRPADAREAIANFAMDSVRVIITARQFNQEERDALTKAKIPFEEYKVALSAVAVIAHKDVPLQQLRVSQLDSIFSGAVSRWPGEKEVIDLVIAGRNSSINEVFKTTVLKGKDFPMSATPIDSSARRIEYIRSHKGSIGLVGVNWLKSNDQDLTVMSLGTPGVAPDSTEKPGQYYSPAQAYVFKGYYPISTPVYIYSREVEPGVSLGFISFATSGPGQKVFLNNGLVPVTMPVRLVKLTSQ